MSGFGKQVTMFSPSVRAAESLPKTVKTQSVKNALIKGGAKPIELEYAGLDGWLQERPGSVTNEELAQFLTEKGPMGRVQRLDAEGETPPYGEPIDRGEAVYDPDKHQIAADRWMERTDNEKPFMTFAGTRPGGRGLGGSVMENDGPRLPSDVRKPTEDSVWVWPHTMYEPLTEGQIHNWRPEDYREISWFDPATRDGNRLWRHGAFDPLSRPDPFSLHNTDWWVRYHLNRTPTGRVIDVQNIQSDVGQDVSALANYERKAQRQTDRERDIREGYWNQLDLLESAGEASYARLRAALSSPDVQRQLVDFLGDSGYDPWNGLREYRPGGFEGVSDFTKDAVRKHVEPRVSTVADNFARRPNSEDVSGVISDHFPNFLNSTGYGSAATELRSLIEQRNRAIKNYAAARHHHQRYAQERVRRGLPTDEKRQWLQSELRASKPSVLFSNDAWMQPVLRYLAMTSARNQGAPIRMPLGVNVRAIEGMPRRAAANKYENVFIRELQKILKPYGGSDVQVTPGTEMAYWEKPDFDGSNDEGRLLRTGPDGERAGATITPREETWQNILKYGLPFFTMLPMVSKPQEQKQQVTGALLQ